MDEACDQSEFWIDVCEGPSVFVLLVEVVLDHLETVFEGKLEQILGLSIKVKMVSLHFVLALFEIRNLRVKNECLDGGIEISYEGEIICESSLVRAILKIGNDVKSGSWLFGFT